MCSITTTLPDENGHRQVLPEDTERRVLRDHLAVLGRDRRAELRRHRQLLLDEHGTSVTGGLPDDVRYPHVRQARAVAGLADGDCETHRLSAGEGASRARILLLHVSSRDLAARHRRRVGVVPGFHQSVHGRRQRLARHVGDGRRRPRRCVTCGRGREHDESDSGEDESHRVRLPSGSARRRWKEPASS